MILIGKEKNTGKQTPKKKLTNRMDTINIDVLHSSAIPVIFWQISFQNKYEGYLKLSYI